MGKNKKKFDFNSGNILVYIIKKSKLLFGITLLAAIIAGVISLTIHDKYKSKVIIFPVSKASVSRSLVEESYAPPKGDFMSIGEDEQVDQLLQVLNSSTIRFKLINKFDLSKHYNIDLHKKGSYSKLYKKLESNIRCSRTEFNSVIVEVWDEKPKIAANMANEISNLIDTVINSMNRDRAVKAYNIVKNEYDSLNHYIGILRDSLIVLHKLGIMEPKTQGKDLIKAYYSAIMKGNTEVAGMIKKQIDILELYGPKDIVLREFIGYEQRQLYVLSNKLSQTKVEAFEKVPNKYVVNAATVAETKDSPKRMIIVIASAISAFFLALFSLITLDSIKKIL